MFKKFNLKKPLAFIYILKNSHSTFRVRKQTESLYLKFPREEVQKSSYQKVELSPDIFSK